MLPARSVRRSRDRAGPPRAPEWSVGGRQPRRKKPAARSRELRGGGARIVRRPGRSGCGFACLSLAGLRSEALELLLEVCDFFTEGRDFVFQVRYALAIGGGNGGVGDGIPGRGRP